MVMPCPSRDFDRFRAAAWDARQLARLIVEYEAALPPGG
jgi:alpha-L-fucosidase